MEENQLLLTVVTDMNVETGDVEGGFFRLEENQVYGIRKEGEDTLIKVKNDILNLIKEDGEEDTFYETTEKGYIQIIENKKRKDIFATGDDVYEHDGKWVHAQKTYLVSLEGYDYQKEYDKAFAQILEKGQEMYVKLEKEHPEKLKELGY